MDKPLIVDGWSEIQEFYDLKYKYHQVDFTYYRDGMFILKVDTDCEMDRRFFPEYHSVSIPDHDPLTFRVVVFGVDYGDSRQTLVGDYYLLIFSKYDFKNSNDISKFLICFIFRKFNLGIRNLYLNMKQNIWYWLGQAKIHMDCL